DGVPEGGKMMDHRLELGCLPALRDEDRDIPLRRHAEVAVNRFREMQEGRRGPSRGESCGNLAPDMPRLAEPADDQLAGTIENECNRLFERTVEAVGQRVERARLVVQYASAEFEHVICHAFALAQRRGSCEA